MQTTVYNEKMLDSVVSDLYSRLEKDKSLNISYEKPEKPKTKNQLGFFFGALCKSIKNFYESQGIDTYSLNDIKENMYYGCSFVNDRLLKHAHRFNGDEYTTPKRLSDMTSEEAGMLIDASIYLIDNAKCFNGLVLHPSIRNVWIRHITQDDIKNINKPARSQPEYLSYLRKQACIVCGRFGCEAHHIKEVGLTGTAYKADDWMTLPLCRDCHTLYHTRGKVWFERQMDWILKYISLENFCLVSFERWRNKL